jgi:hypothetical protein
MREVFIEELQALYGTTSRVGIRAHALIADAYGYGLCKGSGAKAEPAKGKA